MYETDSPERSEGIQPQAALRDPSPPEGREESPGDWAGYSPEALFALEE